jgi:hypothetical protein
MLSSPKSYMKRFILLYMRVLFVLSTSAQQGNCLFEYVQVLVVCHVSGIEGLIDGFGWNLGFWLRDGVATHKYRARVQAGCDVRQHSRGVWNGLGVIQYHLELSTVVKLARNQFNDLRAPGMCECSAR